MSVRVAFFLILFIAGFVGVLSILLIDLNALVGILPVPAGTEVPNITTSLKLLSLVQPTVILFVAVLAGVLFAPQVGLSSPLATAAAKGEDYLAAIRPQILPGIIGGFLGGFAIVLIARIWAPFLPSSVAPLVSQFAKLMPLVTRVLYGGVTEELLLRWGLMTFLAWLAWRIFQKRRAAPTTAVFATAITISSLIFGIGHLPIALMLFPSPPISLIAFVIVANSVFGFIAGFLFWKKGLESAMIAHMTAHLLMFTASYFGAYF